MAPDVRFPLLLLLGLLVLLCPLWALPKKLTKAQWFEIQHIHLSPLQCDRAMSGVNNHTRHCKPTNTFLHDSFQNVSHSCMSPNITCKNGQENCHQSASPVNLTTCRLTRGKYPHCGYKDAAQFKFYIVACEPPRKNDPPYPLVPVHLDGII